ncbi:tetratricopeptide repeat protein [Catenuloplanes sp. NPDC051500]|uniref:tetratricopeptide repeat protein n=1 Tax=Catenuloplanes sp. NPDC051500 TaxID=3363959 RepID=UPI0037A18C8B
MTSGYDRDSLLAAVVQAMALQDGLYLSPQPEQQQSARVTSRQLPAPVRGFTDRARESTLLDRALNRLGTGDPLPVLLIVGGPGVGKTALAVHWMHSLRPRFPDGELVVNLRGYGPDRPLPAARALDRLLQGLGVPPSRIPDDVEDRAGLFRSRIAGSRILILLDNAAGADQIRPLLPGAPGPLFVVTSRDRMARLSAREGIDHVPLGTLPETDAVALVRHITGSARPDDSAADLARLARSCAQLPLALRIAGVRAATRPATPLSELVEDLRDATGAWEALTVQDGSGSDDVRSAFAWSYRELPEAAALLFRMVGLHPVPEIGVGAAAAVAGLSERDARRLADVLAGASTIEATSAGRYRMHDLLHAYARAESYARDPVHARRRAIGRLVGWYALSVDNVARLVSGGDRLLPRPPLDEEVSPARFESADAASAWLDTERQSILSSVRLAESSGLPLHAFALAVAAGAVYLSYFHFDDWAETSEIAVRAAAGTGIELYVAVAERNRGMYLFRHGDHGEARTSFMDALHTFERIGDARGVAETTNALGLVCLRLRDLVTAVDLFTRGANRFIDIGDARWNAVCRSNLAEARIEAGDLPAAVADLGVLVRLFAQAGDESMRGNALWLLSRARRLGGDVTGARTAIEEALVIATELRNRILEGAWLIEAALVRLALDDAVGALHDCRRAAALQQEIGDSSREALAWHCTAEVLAAMGRRPEAAAFHLRAARRFHGLGDTWNEALARVGAADAAAALGRADAEREQLDLAAECLLAHQDPMAVELSSQLGRRLGG